jgi:hypothetical protein
MAAGHLPRDPLLLRASDQMIDQDAEPPTWRRAELGDHLDKPIDAVHRLGHDRQLSQLVTPHVLQQCG